MILDYLEGDAIQLFHDDPNHSSISKLSCLRKQFLQHIHIVPRNFQLVTNSLKLRDPTRLRHASDQPRTNDLHYHTQKLLDNPNAGDALRSERYRMVSVLG